MVGYSGWRVVTLILSRLKAFLLTALIRALFVPRRPKSGANLSRLSEIIVNGDRRYEFLGGGDRRLAWVRRLQLESCGGSSVKYWGAKGLDRGNCS